MSEEEEARRRGAAERAERSREYVEIGEGRKPRVVQISRMPERKPEPKAIDLSDLKCEDTCVSLQDSVGVLTGSELEGWRRTVEDARDEAQADKTRLEDWINYQREANCVTKWTEQCEMELSECDKECPELRSEFQGRTDNVLPKQARDFIVNEATEKTQDTTLPRNEVVDASKQLKCLLKYEGCVTGKKG